MPLRSWRANWEVRLSKWAVRHPILGLIAWVVLMLIVAGAATVWGGKFNDSFALPGVESTTAQNLLAKLPDAGTNNTSIKIVWSPTSGKADDTASEAAIEPLLIKLAAMDQVTCIQTPFKKNYGTGCSSDKNENLKKAVMDGINKELEKKTRLDLSQINDVAKAIEPLAAANPGKLASIAKALPEIAKIAQIPQKDLNTATDIIKLIRKYLPGFDSAQLAQITAAIGDIEKFNATVPANVRDALAAADPAKLAAVAAKLPSEASKLEKMDAELNTEVTKLKEAAIATEKATAQVSTDGKIAYATMTIANAKPPASETLAIWDAVAAANTPSMEVGAQGSVLEGADAGADYSELVGLVAAIIILLIAFGSFVAAGLPIITAVLGIVAGSLLVVVAAKFFTVPAFSPTLAMMIGLGVGIDYALFVLNRFRQGMQDGLDPKAAATKSVGTAGRAVLFAGSTVILALLAMFVLKIEFFNGLAVAAAVTVLMVMLSALLFLPSMLSLLGTHALGIRLPWARTLKPFDPQTSKWSSYGRVLQKAPIIPVIVVLAIIGVLAWPAASMRLGFPDDSTQANGTVLKDGYEMLADGFGPGINGPFFVAVQTTKKDDYAALKHVIEELAATPGVASTLPDLKMLPLMELNKKTFGENGTVTSVLVYPTTGPQDSATVTLLDTIRSQTEPKITDAKIYVGGSQAVVTDFTSVLQKALPVFLLLVIGMGFAALFLLFRSFVIPLTAAITSLLSFAAAIGITVAVFQLGIGDKAFGVTGTGPILPFLPIMVFAILFGLSMDYQVFLVTRMREEWEITHDNKDAVRLGLAGSGKVVVIAASIMTSVFLAFVPTPNSTIKLFGIALASSVIVDAFLVRLILVPSLMSMLGRANWWLPKWLDRILPNIKLE